jgi:uncharacterized membrane protein YuzA (DUF378 family)
MDETQNNMIRPYKQSGAFTMFDTLRLLVHIVCGIAGLIVGLNYYDLLGGVLGLILGLTALGLVVYIVVSFLLALILKVVLGGPLFTPKSDQMCPREMNLKGKD